MSGKTSTASKAKYNSKAYDRIEIVVKKGNKAVLQGIAKEKGKSVNQYIKDLVEQDCGLDL